MAPLTKFLAAVAVAATSVVAFDGDMTWFHPVSSLKIVIPSNYPLTILFVGTRSLWRH